MNTGKFDWDCIRTGEEGSKREQRHGDFFSHCMAQSEI